MGQTQSAQRENPTEASAHAPTPAADQQKIHEKAHLKPKSPIQKQQRKSHIQTACSRAAKSSSAGAAVSASASADIADIHTKSNQSKAFVAWEDGAVWCECNVIKLGEKVLVEYMDGIREWRPVEEVRFAE